MEFLKCDTASGFCTEKWEISEKSFCEVKKPVIEMDIFVNIHTSHEPGLIAIPEQAVKLNVAKH